MTVPMIKSIGDVPYPIDTHSDAFSPLLTAGAALGITGNDAEESAWLARTSGADGVASVRSIHGNTIVQDGALVPVNMTGIESTGFNIWDEEWERGYISDTTGENVGTSDSYLRSKDYIPCLASTEYHCRGGNGGKVMFYDADKGYLSYEGISGSETTFTTPSNAAYMRFWCNYAASTYNNDICINLSDPTRNGTYEPYWQQQRTIPAGILRSAGSVYDEQTATERITRVGAYTFTGSEVPSVENWHPVTDTYACLFPLSMIPDRKAYGSGAVPDAEMAGLDAETYGNVYDGSIGFAMSSGPSDTSYSFAVRVPSSVASTKAELLAWLAGKTLHYALATPTVTPNDPALNLTYRTAAGGTERVMVPTGELSAPPTIIAAQGYTAESLRDAALSAIAPVENGIASTNYGIGSYLVHGGQLCKVTTAIASGEAIAIGTNVTATTVMAEILSLVQ